MCLCIRVQKLHLNDVIFHEIFSSTYEEPLGTNGYLKFIIFGQCIAKQKVDVDFLVDYQIHDVHY